jgi:hypothetical protein
MRLFVKAEGKSGAPMRVMGLSCRSIFNGSKKNFHLPARRASRQGS